MNTGVQVSGFSADVPMFLAMLSARLQMPVRQDVVSTGHIASL
jgi:predicted ATP-dependent protease